MKRMIHALLASLMAAQSATARPMTVQLGGIRSVIPENSNVSRVKYKIEDGPGAKEPTHLRNLTQEQLVEMMKFLAPDMRNPPNNLPPELVDRLRNVLQRVDMYYKSPIPKAEWDRRLEEMRDEFVKQNGQPSAAAKSAQEWETSIDAMIGGFVKKLGDPHTTYMNREAAKNFSEQMRGSFVGIGASVEKVADGVKLAIVFPGSPAEKAGLVDGDVVTAIDGEVHTNAITTAHQWLIAGVGFAFVIGFAFA